MPVSALSPPLIEAALHLARRGWPVFPCNPANKRPLLPRDKDGDGKAIKGSGGVSKATIDEALIGEWWGKWPRAMIGVAVGRADMLVIDFDPRTDVDEVTGEITEWTLDRLKAELEAQIGCALPVSLAVRTPSGGVHVYFRMPPGDPIGNRGNLPRHVDVRGLGGYVIAPPSTAEGGKAYSWLRGDADAAIADLPAPLVDILRAKPSRPDPEPRPAEPRFRPDLDDAHRRYALNALDAEMRELEDTPIGGGRYGGRNAGIYHAALKLGGFVLAGALSEAVVRAALESVVRAMPQNDDLAGALKAIDNGFENATPRDLSNVGTRAARSGDGQRPFAPPDAHADDRPGEVFTTSGAFQSGMAGEGSGELGEGRAIVTGGGARDGRIGMPADPVNDRTCAFFAMTDLGNAERFRVRHGWRFRFCAEIGWFAWDGRRWELLSEERDKVPGAVSLAVFETIRAIRNEAELVEASGLKEEVPDDRDRLNFIAGWRGSGDNKTPVYFSDLLEAHAKASEAAGRLGCVANLAKAFATIAIRADAMDADRMAINVLNGTLRLAERDGKPALRLDEHRPADLISKVANVIYDPRAECPVYDDFLRAVQPSEPMREFLHQWGGLSLTGDIGEQKLVFHHGGGRNGKSTLNDLWATIAGDYAASVAIETFLDQGRSRKGGEATPDLARLPGVRFLRTSEPEKGAKLAEALIKLVTGGEPIDARHLNKGFFTFLPSFKLSVQGNHKPKITGHDDGIWRRMMLVPWDVQIALEDVDARLPEKLRAESSGVFNRLLAGLLDWKTNGLSPPDAVIEATAKYREQSDQLGRFLAECTKPVPGARSKSSVLFGLFTAWCKATGAAEWQPQGFSKAMEDRGFEKKTSNGVQWLDIEMTKTADDYDEGGDRSRRDRDDPGPHYDDDGPL